MTTIITIIITIITIYNDNHTHLKTTAPTTAQKRYDTVFEFWLLHLLAKSNNNNNIATTSICFILGAIKG